MTFALEALIREASTELGAEACREGRHQWMSEGGRGCPFDEDNDTCGQAVYVCATCGTYDYGARGGPGHSDCVATRSCDHREKLAAPLAAA